jgi:hypothetical protein
MPRISLCAVVLEMLIFAAAAGIGHAPAADIVFENARFKAVLGGDATWRSLSEKSSGREFCAADKQVRFARAVVGAKTRSADRAVLAGNRLSIGLAGCDTQLVYEVGTADDWVAWKLVEIQGTRPTHATLVSIGVTPTQRVGGCLNVAWDEQYAVCLMGTNRQTQGRPARQKGWTLLTAVAQDAPGPKLEGSCAALMAAPPQALRAALRRLAAAYDMPRNELGGVPSKELPIARQSYWFLSFGEKDVDRVIELCRQSGFRQVLLSSGSWCASPGHYLPNTMAYPGGIASLRRMTDRFHQQGILVNMHCFASKISKRDPYVTPVPDRRFWVDMSAALVADVSQDATEIRTGDDLSQWPGSPACRQKIWEGGVAKHQETIIDDEIISYDSIGPEGKWNTFVGCKRGSWGTKAAAHKAGTTCRHYGVDGCINGYIIDQETGLFDEAASRLADVFNRAGFDGIYFDGSEDVDRRRYDYYAANAHAVPTGKFARRPFVHTGGGFHHNLWHSFTRSGTVDTYLSTLWGHIQAGGTIDRWPTVRDHIDRSVRYMQSVGDDMIPGELGWFGVWPKGKNTDGLQLDETEYLMAKSLAHNAPISLETSFAQMESHPLTPGILEIVVVYERLRLSGRVPEAALAPLRQPGKDFVLLHAAPATPDELPEFVVVQPVPLVAGARDVRAMLGPRAGGAAATVWHDVGRQGKLVLETDCVTARDVLGNPIVVEKTAGRVSVPIGDHRTTLLFGGMKPEAAQEVLAQARFEVRKPDLLWIPAAQYQAAVGRMVRGSEAGVREPEALGDVILCGGPIARGPAAASYCEYRVQVPRKATWTLWARVRYPTGGDMSFGLVLPGQPVTLDGPQVLGNCGLNDKRWHWTGRGGGSTTGPPGSPITLRLDPGPLVFRIYAREGGGTPATNPRLDCLVLAEDPSYVPTDADARTGLARKR